MTYIFRGRANILCREVRDGSQSDPRICTPAQLCTSLLATALIGITSGGSRALVLLRELASYFASDDSSHVSALALARVHFCSVLLAAQLFVISCARACQPAEQPARPAARSILCKSDLGLVFNGPRQRYSLVGSLRFRERRGERGRRRRRCKRQREHIARSNLAAVEHHKSGEPGRTCYQLGRMRVAISPRDFDQVSRSQRRHWPREPSSSCRQIGCARVAVSPGDLGQIARCQRSES